MGNCARKMRRDLYSIFKRKKDRAKRIGSPVICPHCRTLFDANTMYSMLTNHINGCAALHSNNNQVILNIPTSPNNNPNVPIALESNIMIPLSNQNNRPSESYVWVKNITNQDEIKWEKQSITKTLSDKELKLLPSIVVKTLNFEQKQRWFRIQCNKDRIPWTEGADKLVISKADILKDSIDKIKNVNLLKETKIAFVEENKVLDAGGLLREWIYLIIKELFSESTAIFKKADTGEMTYCINSYSDNTVRTLELYKFAGKVFGKAIFESIPINAHLDRCLLKQIISKPLTLDDIKYFDKPVMIAHSRLRLFNAFELEQIYKSLVYIKDNTINGNDDFEEYFTIQNNGGGTGGAGANVSGSMKDSKSHGEIVRVTDENKLEYIDLKVNWLGKLQNERKINNFLIGLNMVIRKETLSIFEINELEMLINGLPFIDIDDWEANTIYKGAYYKNHQVIRWLWKAMRTLNQNELAKFLQFCTASSRVPVEGFRVLQSNRGEYAKFCIENVKYDKDNPNNNILRAHTCFNRLDLPQFPTEALVQESITSILALDFSGIFGIE